MDEGDFTYIMSHFCWKATRSPQPNQSLIALKAFDGRGFNPYGILSSLQIELG